MLTPKEICDLFEVQINTLYNWRKTKPKLYSYLQNADYNLKRNNEINVLLDFYSKTFSKTFTLNEIQYLIDAEFELNSIEEVNSFHTIFIKSNYKLLNSESNVILNIYDKINELNIIEKYILYKKIYRIRNIEELDLVTFFNEFLINTQK
mgnify:CR=1 FL=1